jgi:putative hydrolase of the HAD superfamily
VSPEFLQAILDKLKIPSTYVAMVGDNFDKDIKPALAVGLQPYWFTTKKTDTLPNNVKVISELTSLYR